MSWRDPCLRLAQGVPGLRGPRVCPPLHDELAAAHADDPVDRIVGLQLDPQRADAIGRQQVVQAALKGMTTLRQQILELLKVSIETYTRLRDGWWRFAIA